MNKKPFFVLLDLDDTILDFRTAEHRALTRAFSELGLDYSQPTLDRYSEINAWYWQQLEKGVMSREQILVGRFDALLRERGVDFPGKTAQDLYENYLCQGHFFMPGAEALLEELHGKYPLYLLSNGNSRVQAARLQSAGISPYFADIFVSETMGVDKPSLAFFEACFARMADFDPARALMVGDSLSSDILGGQRAGLRTCWYNYRGRPADPDIQPSFTITDLAELPPLLEKLAAEE